MPPNWWHQLFAFAILGWIVCARGCFCNLLCSSDACLPGMPRFIWYIVWTMIISVSSLWVCLHELALENDSCARWYKCCEFCRLDSFPVLVIDLVFFFFFLHFLNMVCSRNREGKRANGFWAFAFQFLFCYRMFSSARIWKSLVSVASRLGRLVALREAPPIICVCVVAYSRGGPLARSTRLAPLLLLPPAGLVPQENHGNISRMTCRNRIKTRYVPHPRFE
jgi:hypothetical protein